MLSPRLAERFVDGLAIFGFGGQNIEILVALAEIPDRQPLINVTVHFGIEALAQHRRPAGVEDEAVCAVQRKNALQRLARVIVARSQQLVDCPRILGETRLKVPRLIDGIFSPLLLAGPLLPLAGLLYLLFDGPLFDPILFVSFVDARAFDVALLLRQATRVLDLREIDDFVVVDSFVEVHGETSMSFSS